MRAFFNDESGSTAIEYGLIASLIAVAAIVPLIARAVVALPSRFVVITKNAGTVLIGPRVSMKIVKMNIGVIIGRLLPSDGPSAA